MSAALICRELVEGLTEAADVRDYQLGLVHAVDAAGMSGILRVDGYHAKIRVVV